MSKWSYSKGAKRGNRRGGGVGCIRRGYDAHGQPLIVPMSQAPKVAKMGRKKIEAEAAKVKSGRFSGLKLDLLRLAWKLARPGS